MSAPIAVADSRFLIHNGWTMTRQARYQRRRRAVLLMMRVVADPQEVADLIRACGLTPIDASPETLAEGLQMVIELCSRGDLLVDRRRDSA